MRSFLPISFLPISFYQLAFYQFEFYQLDYQLNMPAKKSRKKAILYFYITDPNRTETIDRALRLGVITHNGRQTARLKSHMTESPSRGRGLTAPASVPRGENPFEAVQRHSRD